MPEIRYRGIYEVILYRSQIILKASFAAAEVNDVKWQAHYDRSKLIVGVSDLKGISQLAAKLNGQTTEVTADLAAHSPVPCGFSIQVDGKQAVNVEITFDLNGCRELLFSTIGQQTDLNLSGKWGNPSFCGSFLPVERTIDYDNFSAQWSVGEFNRSLPRSWIGNAVKFKQPDIYIEDSGCHECAAGVKLVKTADTYAQVNRAVEYDVLIFIIVLMAMLAAERLSKVWVHPLQYFVAGIALVFFYTLLLAISEHLPFAAAYVISTAAIAGLSGFYSGMIYRKWAVVPGMIFAVSAAYAAIYVILQLEDYALLAGAGILFVLLTVLMIFTGRINGRDAGQSAE